MARAPLTLAESSARRILPNAQFNPQRATAEDFGAGAGQAAQQAGAVVNEAAEFFHAEQVKLQTFKEEKAFLDFTDAEAQRIDASAQEVGGDANEYTKNTMAGYDQGASAFLESVAPARRQQWELKAAQVRQKYAGAALQTELGQRQKFYKEQVNDGLTKIGREIGANPGGFEVSQDKGRQLILASGLPQSAKESALLQWEEVSANAYAIGIFDTQGGEGLMKALGGSTTKAGDYDLSGAKGNEKVAADLFKSKGLSPVAVAGMVGTLSHEGAGMNPKARNPGDGRDGSDSIGVAQWNAERAVALKKFASDRGKPWEDLGTQLEFVLHEMKTGDANARKAYRMLQDADTVEEAVAAMNYYERPAGWKPGGDPSKVMGWSDRVARANRIAGKAAPVTEAGIGAADPRLAALSVERVAQLRDTAERKIKQDEGERQQADARAHAEWLNGFEIDLMDGKKGRADIEEARKSNLLTDFDEINRAESIVTQREKAQDDSTSLAAMLNNPGFVWNPVDGDQKKAINAGVDGMVRSGTYNTVTGVAIWQKTGIMPEKTGNEIRGMLLSSDPARVTEGAALSANLVRANPNAFASMGDGRADVEKAAVEYNRLIDIGYDAKYAAGRVAAMNDPKRRNEVQAKEDDSKVFAAELRKGDATADLIGTMALDKQFGTDWSPQGERKFTLGDANMRRGVVQDYNDIALEHFKQHGDKAAARAFAKQQMTKLYGMENGVLLKYPATKAYPPINGSTDYVHQQAAGDIAAVTGKKVEADDVILMPIPGLTSEQFRNGQPAQYQVFFRDRSGDGPPVIEMLPGRAFQADISKAKREANARAKAKFEKEREKRKSMEAVTGAMIEGQMRSGGSVF